MMTTATSGTTHSIVRGNSRNREQECTGKITQNNIATSVARAISGQRDQECTGKITDQFAMTISGVRENSRGRNQEIAEKITNFGSSLVHSPKDLQTPVKTSNYREHSVSSALSATPARLNPEQQQELDRARQLIRDGMNELSQKRLDAGLVKLEQGIQAFSLVTTVHKELADANLLVANAHEQKNALSKALICYENAVAIYEKLETDPKILNKLYKKVALVLEGLGKADAAIMYNEKIAKFYESEQRTTTLTTLELLDLATIYDKIALLLEAQHKPQEDVLPYHFKRAAIYERYKPNSIALASCYDKIGFLLKSDEYYQKSLSIEEGLPKEEKDQFFSRVRTMYDAQRQTRECNSNFVNANKEARSSDVFSCATSYLFMAKVNEAYTQMKTAVESYESILNAKSKISPKSSFLAASFENIGDAHISGKKTDKAVPFYIRSLGIYSQILPEVDPILVSLRQKAKGLITTVQENSVARTGVSMSQARMVSVSHMQMDSVANNQADSTQTYRARSVVPEKMTLNKLKTMLRDYHAGKLWESENDKAKNAAAKDLLGLIDNYENCTNQKERDEKCQDIVSYMNTNLHHDSPVLKGDSLRTIVQLTHELFKIGA